MNEGRNALMHVDVREHIVSRYYRTARSMFTKRLRGEVFMTPDMHYGISGISAQGRVQGVAKIGHGVPILQKNSSSDQKATATNRIHCNDLGACGRKCCNCWFHSEVTFLTRF